jgi:very-short-patch-repair endonuclease/endogenous inhibitor of DNA gyrase (YacG/DUF329 family)
MKWNKETDEELIRLVNDGKSRDELSNIIGVSLRSIDSRCYRLKITIHKREYTINTICVNCGKTFKSFIRDKRKFCSKTCSTDHYNSTKIVSINTKSKISNALKGRKSPFKKIRDNCIICGKKVNKLENIYCSRKCKNESDIYRKKMSDISIERYKLFPEQHPNIRCSNIRETYPEKFFKQYLLDNGLIENIDFNFQYSIGRYFVDFYFSIINLTVEIDGERWHDKESEKEKIREKYIRERSELIRFDVKPLLKKEYEKVVLDIIRRVK